MASLTRTIRRKLKWTKPKSNADVKRRGVYVKPKFDREDIVKEDTNGRNL